MASSSSLITFYQALFIFLLFLSVHRAEASTALSPSFSAQPPPECMSELVGLSGCLPYVQEGSAAVEKPDPACCWPLKKLMKEKPECLCQAFASGSTFGVSLNITKALSLPSACDLKTPSSFSKCKSHGRGISPTTAPSAAEKALPEAPSPSPAAIFHRASSAAIFHPAPFLALILSGLIPSIFTLCVP